MKNYIKEDSNMAEIKNKEALVNIINFYKQSKITRNSAELELSKAVSETIGQDDVVQVKIIEEKDSSTNSTFGIVSLPEKTGERVHISILIDKDAVMNLMSPEEILALLETELDEYQTVLKDYSKFLKSKGENELSVSDTLVFFLGLYKDSLERFSKSHKEVYDRLRNLSTIQSAASIESEIKAIESGNFELSTISERLLLSKKMPHEFEKAAKALASISQNNISQTSKIPLFYRDEEPVMNQFYQQRRALSDGTFDIEKKGRSSKIEHNYLPKTNQ
jgi:hypothetical protein